MTLTEFLQARLAEDEAVARSALDPQRLGTRWQWVRAHDDVPVEEPIWEDGSVSLRSVEEFPTSSGVGDLPAFVVNHVEVDEPRALPHIARHDPARVLADVEAKRRIVDWVKAQHIGAPSMSSWADWLLHTLAAVYSDHPDYREEWKS